MNMKPKYADDDSDYFFDGLTRAELVERLTRALQERDELYLAFQVYRAANPPKEETPS